MRAQRVDHVNGHTDERRARMAFCRTDADSRRPPHCPKIRHVYKYSWNDVSVTTEGSDAGEPPLINRDDTADQLYWAARLGCSSPQLRVAVRTVGPNANDVREYLRMRKLEGA